MNIYLDIETCPSQNPAVRADILANIKPPATHKKQETIDAWLKDNAEAEAETAWRKTSFDGGLGHICVIGLAFDDEPAFSLFSDTDWLKDERAVLANFFKTIDDRLTDQPNVRPTFIGHNLIDFDLRFIFQRAVVLGVKPAWQIPFNCKPWDSTVFDTMQRWDGKNRAALAKLSKALDLDDNSDIDGSMVWDYVREGRIAEIAAYCENDIDLTRALHRRMTFADLPIAA